MDLSHPGVLRPFLEKHGIQARKGLGQHFLCSSSVVQGIANRLEGVVSALEIGPGPGILTAMLCERCAHVAAIELDRSMEVPLSESAPCATVHWGNALDVDIRSILDDLVPPRAVVSNLPYYLTGPLLGRISDVDDLWDRAILMMQKEVGTRMMATAHSSERGALSVSFQLRYEIEKVCDVPPGAFLPPPKVESIVLQLQPKTWDGNFEQLTETLSCIKAGFRQPRKTLANNLNGWNGADRELIVSALDFMGLSPTYRPQQLENGQWIELARRLSLRG